METLSQRQKMEKAYSPSQDMAEYVDSYLKGGKLHGEQASLVETWTVIGESGLVQLLRNAYKRRTQHQFWRIINQESKPSKSISVFLQVHQPYFLDF